VFLARDNETTVTDTKTSTADRALAKDTWAYLTISLAMTGGKDTDILFYKDNTADAAQTMSNLFVVDKETYPAYIGNERTAETTYTSKWTGFVYNFQLYA
jgi:hypothetical protein